MMRKLGQYVSLIKHLGLGWVWFRLCYVARRRLGALRRASPAVPWSAIPAPVLWLGPASTIPPEVIAESAVGEAEAVLRGEFRLFSHRMVKAGFPPDWQRNWLTEDGGRTAEGGGLMSDVCRPSSEAHWSEISDFGGGDIKGIWEFSRFPWAFALARAHRRTSDGKYGEAFWALFVDWCAHNPPNQGANWMCGQEASFRLMAVVFAADVIGVPENQRAALSRFVVATGRRIAANLDYALSQKNNHGLSECVGLITAALVLPGHGESPAWLERAQRCLQRQLAELVYADGGFSQHSLMYHRVLLHDLCWARSRWDGAGQGAPGWLSAAADRALGFLMTVTDPATGQAPLYGSNDGANALPLADAAFGDLRPAIQLASAAFRSELPLPAGPWDESAAWLVPDWARQKRTGWPATPVSWHAPEAGFFQLSHGADRLLLRCPTRFRHRPAQMDMLHVDVWHEGRAVAADGGSYSYNSRERFGALADAAQHNGVTVDGIEPGGKFSRFLYLPWPKGKVWPEGEGLRASHDGYDGLGVSWTRTVEWRPGGGFLVRDRVGGGPGRRWRWHWRLADGPWHLAEPGTATRKAGPGEGYTIRWHGPAQLATRLVRAAPDSATGWWSPHYGEVEPAVALVLEASGESELTLTTEFIPNA